MEKHVIFMFEQQVSIIVQLCFVVIYKKKIIPLELIIFPGFSVIPLIYISFPSQENFKKIKSYRPQRL